MSSTMARKSKGDRSASSSGETSAKAGGNWEQLKSKLPADTSAAATKRKQRREWLQAHGGKRLNGVKGYMTDNNTEAGPSKPRVEIPSPAALEGVVLLEAPNDEPLVRELRDMVVGKTVLNEAKRAPGNYIAIDCEMVGIHEKGSESTVARVSLVNYHGHILLDTFVQPREKVTDYRTWVSGVRASDLEGAPVFDVVQKQVSELVEGRTLVGHAIENDMKALLLSHPAPMIRDTQKCKVLRERSKTKMPSLRKLSAMELGLEIQKAAHSSVTDARATMALYRLHKVEWEQSVRPQTEAYRAKMGIVLGKGKDSGGKRKRGDESDSEEGEDDEDPRDKKKKESFPGGGRKGVSSGLSVIVRRGGKRVDGPRQRGVPRPSTEIGGAGAASWWEDI